MSRVSAAFDLTASRSRRRGSAVFSASACALLMSSCATVPVGENKGKPIFNSFNQGMVANGAGAVMVALATTAATGNRTLGLAAAAGTLFLAWRACGKAHQSVMVSDERGRDAALADPQYRNASAGVLRLESLEVVAPKAGEDITTRYRFGFISPDSGKKDIQATERFVYLAGFINDKNQQEFKEIEFERDFVIQQGRRQHEHAVPSDASFGRFKPWKLRYTLEVEGRCVETETTFALDSSTPGRGGPAKACVPRAAPNTAPGQAASPVAVPASPTVTTAAPAPTPATSPPAPAPAAAPLERTLSRALRLQTQPGGTQTGKTLAQGTKLRILETKPHAAAGKTANWVRVQSVAGDSGWTLEANLKR